MDAALREGHCLVKQGLEDTSPEMEMFLYKHKSVYPSILILLLLRISVVNDMDSERVLEDLKMLLGAALRKGHCLVK